MAKEPFTIRLLVGIMPSLKTKILNNLAHISKITMYEILQIFTDKWIENEIYRLSI
jgi:hypothetical protein